MRDIKLDSTAWIDLVFDGKNKNYGAYKLRELSTKRHLIAFLCTVLLAAFLAFLPTLIETVTPKAKEQVQIAEVTQLIDLELEKQLEEQQLIREETAPPPPPLKETVQYVAPKIVDAEEVTDENELKSQDELLETKIQISILDQEGTDDEDAVDIADLQQHQVVIEEKVEEQIYRGVEQMPEFPGGEKELMKYLNDNITYPVIAAENGIQGRVTLEFVVSETGAISDVKVIQKLDPSCDKEAMRVIQAMPKWIPGMQNGRAVKVYYTVPVTFKLQN